MTTSQTQNENHGGLSHRELMEYGINPAQVLDFSVNVNPFGPSPKVLDVIRQFDPSSYPDRDCDEIRMHLAALNDARTEEILVGNGTAEMILLIAHAFLRGKSVLIFGPTFGEYERGAKMVGASVIQYNAKAPNFELSIEEIRTAINTCNPDVIFLCNPNNPTGRWLDREDIKALVNFCQDRLLILDEAYRAFVTMTPFGPPYSKHVILLRSMTKDFSLAGIRLGYAMADPDKISVMKSIQPSWSVNGLAQQAGIAALEDLQYLSDTLRKTRDAAEEMHRHLQDIGARLIPSSTHFCLIDVNPLTGQVFRRAMLTHKIQVRDCASFGLERWVRIGTRKPQENQELVDAWKTIISSGKAHDPHR